MPFRTLLAAGLLALTAPAALNAHDTARFAQDHLRMVLRLEELPAALFHAVVACAQRSLILTRVTADAKGDPVRPSAFWEAALDVYRSEEDAAAGSQPETLVSEREGLRDLERVAPAHLPGRMAERSLAATFAPMPPSRGALTDELVRTHLAERNHRDL